MPKNQNPASKTPKKSGWLDQLAAKVDEAEKNDQSQVKTVKKPDDHQYRQKSYLVAFLKQKKEKTIIWFSGIFKEFSRIAWLKGNKLWLTFFVVLVVLVVGGLIFYLVAKLASLI